jgi:hypothetical protein
MEMTKDTPKDAPRIYTFGPIFKTLLVIISLAMIVIGVTGAMQSYTQLNSVGAQFAGVLLSMIPIAAALFGAPMLWRCKLTLFEDRLEYNGLLIDTVIRKTDVINALSREPRYGVFSIFLTLAGKSLHIAVLGRMDEAIRSWVDALPHGDTYKA